MAHRPKVMSPCLISTSLGDPVWKPSWERISKPYSPCLWLPKGVQGRKMWGSFRNEPEVWADDRGPRIDLRQAGPPFTGSHGFGFSSQTYSLTIVMDRGKQCQGPGPRIPLVDE